MRIFILVLFSCLVLGTAGLVALLCALHGIDTRVKRCTCTPISHHCLVHVKGGKGGDFCIARRVSSLELPAGWVCHSSRNGRSDDNPYSPRRVTILYVESHLSACRDQLARSCLGTLFRADSQTLTGPMIADTHFREEFWLTSAAGAHFCVAGSRSSPRRRLRSIRLISDLAPDDLDVAPSENFPRPRLGDLSRAEGTYPDVPRDHYSPSWPAGWHPDTGVERPGCFSTCSWATTPVALRLSGCF